MPYPGSKGPGPLPEQSPGGDIGLPAPFPPEESRVDPSTSSHPGEMPPIPTPRENFSFAVLFLCLSKNYIYQYFTLKIFISIRFLIFTITKIL